MNKEWSIAVQNPEFDLKHSLQILTIFRSFELKKNDNIHDTLAKLLTSPDTLKTMKTKENEKSLPSNAKAGTEIIRLSS